MEDATEAFAREDFAVDNSTDFLVNENILSESDSPNSDSPPLLPDIAQNERGVSVRIDRSRDEKLTQFGKETLLDRYLMPDESF